jgi:rhodanese-related sulfurtransferase
MKKITPEEIKQWTEEGHSFVLIDVREDWEREAYNIGGKHIPMDELWPRRNEIPQDKDVVLYCEKGIRSTIVIQRLETAGFNNLYNLTGGMKAWKEVS